MGVIFEEILAGFITGFAVSPMNKIVDTSIIEHANGKTYLWTGVRNRFKTLFFTPAKFFSSVQFRWILFVYFPTYAVSNLADHYHLIPMVNPAINQLLMTFLVNTVTSLMKDRALARALGATDIRPFPKSALSLLFLRDIVAIAAGFTIPKPMGRSLSKYFGITEKQGYQIAQLTAPLLVQFIGTPLHLLGLDVYNRENQTMKSRLTYIKGIYFNVLALRMLRFLPAFGIGGLVNTELREYFERNRKVKE